MANRYENIKQFNTSDGITYRSNAIYPEVVLSEKDYYIITTAGDRYDTLAQQFYNDYSLWWIIAAANNSEHGSLNVEPGVQLRVPFNYTEIISQYNQVNKNR
jgi:hypothetical protein